MLPELMMSDAWCWDWIKDRWMNDCKSRKVRARTHVVLIHDVLFGIIVRGVFLVLCDTCVSCEGTIKVSASLDSAGSTTLCTGIHMAEDRLAHRNQRQFSPPCFYPGHGCDCYNATWLSCPDILGSKDKAVSIYLTRAPCITSERLSRSIEVER